MPISSELGDFCARIMDATKEDLDLIAKTVQTRRRFLSEMREHENQGTICVGDVVEILDNVQGQYLHGCEFEVLEIRENGLYGVVVAIGNARFPNKAETKGRGWRGILPFSCVVKH